MQSSHKRTTPPYPDIVPPADADAVPVVQLVEENEAPVTTAAPERLVELDSMRGLAALIVFVYHCILLQSTHAGWMRVLMVSPLTLFLFGGHQAVILFFVLSGFVLYLPWTRGQGGGRYRTFLIKRLCRIYLPYLVSVFVALIAYGIFFNPAQPDGLSRLYGWQVLSSQQVLKLLWNSVLFIGFFKRDALNGVTWTLAEEMRISFVFPLIALAVLRWKSRTTLIVALAGSTIVAIGIALVHRRSPLETVHYACLFALGAVLAGNRGLLKKRWLRQSSRTRALALSTAILVAGYAPILQDRYPGIVREELADWLIALSVGVFLVMSMAGTQLSIWLRHGFMLHCGRTSYGIYLLHLPILFVCVNLLWARTAHVVVFVLAFALTMAAAECFYRFVEEPSIALGKRLTRTRMAASLPQAELTRIPEATS